MTGLEIILLAAFVAVAIFAFVENRYANYYLFWQTRTKVAMKRQDKFYWEAIEEYKKFHDLYVVALSAAQDLDKLLADCLSIIDDADADMAWMSALISERDSDITLWLGVADDSKKEIGELRETIARQNIDIATITQKHSNSMPRCKDCGKLIGKQAWDCGDHFECDTCHEKEAKAVEPATPADLTDAPFEGLDGVKEGDSVLFSDGVVRVVKRIDFNYEMQDRIVVSPSITESSGMGYGCVFKISTGKHWKGKTTIRAIRIATPLNCKLYQFADVSKKIEKPLLADAKVGDLCQLRNGDWKQLKERDANSSFSLVGRKYPIATDEFVYQINGHIQYDDKEDALDIIHTEPLAPEGTAEWAWQMMLLGNKVYLPNVDKSFYEIEGIYAYRRYTNHSHSYIKEQFLSDDPTGWQLYRESDK